MSLSALLKLRLQGKRPAGPVTVLVGKRPNWREDDETLVVIAPTAEPNLMDFRPLVGLWTTLVVLGDNYQHAGRVLAAIDAAGAKLFGAAANNGQMIVDSGAKTKAAEAFETLAQIVSRRELPTAPVKGKAAAPSGAPNKKGGSLFASLFSKKR